MEKPRPERPARPSPPESELDLVVQRCPFCREGLRGSAQVVSCAVCNARHHMACWDEHAACASCGASARLVPEPAGAAETARPGDGPSWASLVLWIVTGGLAAVALAAALLFQKVQRPQAPDAGSATAAAARARDSAPIRANRELLGLELAATDDGMLVAAVLPGSRAARAGLQPGDLLLTLTQSDTEAFDVRYEIRSAASLADALERLGSDARWLALWIERDGVRTRLPLPN